MSPSSWFGAGEDRSLQVLWEDGERVFCRGWRQEGNGNRNPVLAVLPAAEYPAPASLHRLTHEYALKDDLDEAWAVRPLELVRERGRTMLLLKDPGGKPLDRLIGRPMAIARFLRLAIALTTALGRLHERGLIHKDLKPANVLVKARTGQVWLMGFGIASRLPRERQAPEPPEVIAGTLPYMAPEQTGRMNRSIDSRSDLYALGVTLYQLLTGSLPFTASDPMEWMHCHIARQPVPPSERVEHVPVPVSQIIMKLLAKTAEGRYQTAAGLESDLRRCLAEWDTQGRIDAFSLGEHDTPDQLLIPEKLYGRARQIETLLAAFDRIVQGGTPELVLVSGYSGIGKSSVVNELHKVLVPPRGLFASGKFDQFKRDIPYSTLAQAFQSLIRPLLAKSDAELSRWRHALLEALGPNGRLLVDVVPELKLIIGEQPPVPDLPPQDAQQRFQRVFRRFIDVFARPEHPLALFLDDLQWLDTATLDLIEDLLTQSDLQHLMLIGAYRDNEVTAAHPLMRTLDAIKTAGGKVAEITLAPLARGDLGQLIADALRCEPERAVPLAQLVHEKTGGNPFFAIQFISSLDEEGMLTFDHNAARWSWDLDRIHAKGYADNVVDLMVGKLTRLPAETQAAVQQLACIGNTAEIAMLSIAFGTSEEQVHTALSEAVLLELVERQKGSYKFVHDRVQEAAYSLIPEASRAAAHLGIGRLLAAQTPPAQREEMIFEIAGQLNRGAALIIEQGERERLAELNLIAGKRAKASTAYASARTYLSAGMALLGREGWTSRYELAFGLCIERAECEYVDGNNDEAEQLISQLLARGVSKIDKAAAYRLKIDLHVMKAEYPKAVESALECLRLFGIEMSPHPAREQVEAEYEKVWSGIGGRPIESLIDLPLMTDPEMQAAMRVLSVLNPPAYFTADINLVCLHLCHMVNITLKYGTTGASTHAYAWFGVILGPVFHRFSDGFRFGRLACDLVEKHGFVAKAKSYI
jgi:predicted ATPase